MAMQVISPEALMALRAQGRAKDFVDVRTPVEFRAGHAEGARNAPLEKLDISAVLASRIEAADAPIYVICQSGGRSSQACAKFVAGGFANVVNVEGGTAAWEKAGLPMIRAGKALPLDRQVQLAAGVIALAGVVLGTWVSAWFYLLDAMVGCGMTLSGLVGCCPMGILLATMPWNQCGSQASSCSCTPPQQAARGETVEV